MIDSSLVRVFSPAVAVPECFPSPFEMQPHALARQACDLLKARLPQLYPESHDFNISGGGKMLGTLVVKTTDSTFAYLSGYSGMLGGEWLVPGFVPPAFDLAERDSFLPAGEAQVKALALEVYALQQSDEMRLLNETLSKQQRIADVALSELKIQHRRKRELRAEERISLQGSASSSAGRDLALLARQSSADKREFRELSKVWQGKIGGVLQAIDSVEQKIKRLERQRAELSRQLQKLVFRGYKLNNRQRQTAVIDRFFSEKLPPGGAGDCVAVKLLQSCFALNLEPVCLGEFWWGAEPRGGIRHHGHYYPACRGKCAPILPFMMEGLSVKPPRYETVQSFPVYEPAIVYEDSDLVVVEKPAGMLSVPGKRVSDSVEQRLRQRYPEVQSTMLVHRLDQATSGLLVAAKSANCRSVLQGQFQRREVAKKYIAELDGVIANEQGVIELPLRVDIDDRPRQCVCRDHGKASVTRYRVVSSGNHKTRIEFFPVTGRTHQLRVHAAHPEGLKAAIVGDELYGRPDERLFLHAASISFNHPASGERLTITSPVPF